MSPEQLLDARRLPEALAALQALVRDQPTQGKHRFFLFQLLSILGDWNRALTQLNVAAEFGGEFALAAQVYRPALQCEAFREDVFAGKHSPLIFGQPQDWLAMLIRANQAIAGGDAPAAKNLTQSALRTAPVTPGHLDGEAFPLIFDADSRLGPVLEVILEGKYFWIPFSRIRQISISPPKDLHDLVWARAEFTWSNNGMAVGLIPVRYATPSAPDELHDDPAILMSHKTEWISMGENYYLGVGQRVLAVPGRTAALLDLKQIKLETTASIEEIEVVGPGEVPMIAPSDANAAAPRASAGSEYRRG